MLQSAMRCSQASRLQDITRALSTQGPLLSGSQVTQDSKRQDAISRVSKAYGHLSEKNFKFIYSSAICHRLYTNANASLLEDALYSSKLNESIFTFLISKFKWSGSIRALLLLDLQRIWNNGNYHLMTDILQRLSLHHKMPNLIEQKTLEGSRRHTANCLVGFAALAGEPLIGCSFVKSFKEQGVTLDSSTVKTLFRCLCGSQGQQQQYHSYAMLRLLCAYPNVKLNDEDMTRIIRFSLVGSRDCYVANLIFQELQKQMESDKIMNSLVMDAAELLIKKNMEVGQYDRALKIWLFCANPNIHHDHEIVRELLNNIGPVSGDQVINMLDHSLLPTKMLDVVLEYLARRNYPWKRIQLILDSIQPPFSRSTLSALLRVFLMRGKDAEAKRVLDSIFRTKSKLNVDDTNEIVTKLLKDGDINKAIELARGAKHFTSSKAWLSIFKFLLHENDPKKHYQMVRDAALSLKSADSNSLWKALPLMIESLSRTHDIMVARSLLDTVRQEKPGQDSERTKALKVIRWGLPQEVSKIIRITSKGIIASLYILLDKAVKEDDLEMIKWCITELRVEGTLVTDVLGHIERTDFALYEKYFNISK